MVDVARDRGSGQNKPRSETPVTPRKMRPLQGSRAQPMASAKTAKLQGPMRVALSSRIGKNRLGRNVASSQVAMNPREAIGGIPVSADPKRQAATSATSCVRRDREGCAGG